MRRGIVAELLPESVALHCSHRRVGARRNRVGMYNQDGLWNARQSHKRELSSVFIRSGTSQAFRCRYQDAR